MTAVDQDIRDRAIRETERSFALAAGAGSGKTSVLTARVLELLVRGVAPGRIAAITFTEKAAGELQARVRDLLERQLAEGSDATLEGALQQLPDLQLSTIHAFCQRLLTLEALEARWAPDTEVLAAVIQSEGVASAYRRWTDGFAERHPASAFLVRSLVSSKALREAAFAMVAFRDLAPVVDVLPFDAAAAFPGLLEARQRLLDAAATCIAPTTDKLLASNRTVLAMLEEAVSLPPAEAVAYAVASSASPKRTGGRKPDWPGGGKQDFLDALAHLEAWRQGQWARLHGLVVTDLAEHFLPAAEAAKADHGVADFDDLLFRAAELLAIDPVRARLAGRYDALLVDEVQDTDPIQAEVAALLTRPPLAGGPWNAHAPEPGRLFAVGDPRQSIYRFRRADVATWDELQALIVAGGEQLTLVQNFRSVPGVVDWVNATFRNLPGYVPQKAFRSGASLEPVVRLACEPDEQHEAIARYLLQLMADGQVADRETGELRPLRWSDVMLLLPAWSASERLRDALTRAGIPSLVEGGGAFFERDEVRLCLAALHVLDEPADEERTVFVVRGLFGIDWPTLAAHKALGGAWRHTVPDPPPGPVADAYRVLSELARQRGRRPWVDLLDDLLGRTRAAATWAGLQGGEARIANLDKLRALLRQVELSARSPSEALRLLDELDKEKDLSRDDLDNDAVRITSYFKAKGLEAPVVVLPHANRKRDGVVAAVDRTAREVAIKVGPLVPRDWEEREQADKDASDAERARWMYVAATRARDQLVLVDYEEAKLLQEHVDVGLSLATPVDWTELPEVPWREETFPGLDDAVDGWLQEPAPMSGDPDPTDAWHAARVESLRASRSACTRWRSVQEVAARERVARRGSPVGQVGGRVVHDVLELLDLSQPVDELMPRVEPLARAAAAELGLEPELLPACVDIVHGILGHPVLEWARLAPERWVEVPFTIRDKGRLVSGRIDLAFPTDASRTRWIVVDWKSDLPARDTPAWRNYQRQLQLYAKALLATVSPCEHVETILVGPHADLGAADHADEAVAEVLPELADGLRALLEAGAPVPRVGGDAGDPVVAFAELAWDEAKVALCVGQPEEEVAALRAQGWSVASAQPEGVSWAEEALDALRKPLGLGPRAPSDSAG